MTIHSEHPFLPPESGRNPLRRLRGRLPAPVTIWSAGTGAARVGWTVSSLLVVDGEPGRLIGMLDPESDLADRLTTKDCFTVNLLGWQHRALGDVFAGTAPAPGGAFRQARWTDSDWGPVLDGAIGWVGARLDPAVPATELGWSLQVTAVIEHIELADAASGDPDALAFLRGRYRPLPLEADTPRSPGPGHR